MLSLTLISAVFAMAVTATPLGLAEPKLLARNTEIVPSVDVCTGAVGSSSCVNIPVVSDTCVNFTGGLSFLNGEVSNVVVPAGFVCTFVNAFGCDASKGGGVFLQGGSWHMSSVPGTSGNINFNDLASSFTCSPV